MSTIKANRYENTATTDNGIDIDSSGLVGIGESSPGSYDAGGNKLVLTDTTNCGMTIRGGTTGQSAVYFADGTTGNEAYRGRIEYSHSSDSFGFGTAGTGSRMVIDSSGRVGIGTTSLGHKLVVNQNNSGGIAAIHLPQDESTILGYHSTTYLKFGGNMTVGAASSIIFENAGSEAARIDSSNRMLLGVSSSSADARLVVAGSTTPYDSQILMASTGNQPSSNTKIGGIKWSDNRHDSNIGGEIALWSDGSWAGSNAPGRLVFSTTASGASSPSERMRITNAGLIAMGTTNPASTPSQGFCFDTRSDSLFRIGHANGTGSGSNYVLFGYNSGNIGSITQSGTTAVSYNTTSDYRLKENLIPLTGAANRITQIPVHRFNFIAEPNRTVDGFIAHEVQAVVPEAVTGVKDGDEMQGIDQSKLVPLLTAALQEAIAKIETLEQRLSDAGIS